MNQSFVKELGLTLLFNNLHTGMGHCYAIMLSAKRKYKAFCPYNRTEQVTKETKYLFALCGVTKAAKPLK